MNFPRVILSLLVLFTAAFAGSNQDFKFSFPNYSYHKFDNGFELILVENRTNPLIASVVVVRTGLRNETPENNGVSHMLEHMTFNGTDRRTQKQLYDELDFHGIYLNAQTSEDYTTFMALNHKEQISPTLDILSDMLFHSTFSPAKFEKEKGIIVEEIRKDSENPDYKEESELRKAFYLKPPYALPVLGTVETVRNMSREQVLSYYREYYSPNNMIAIVIGDFDSADMLNKMRQYFGGVPAQRVEKRRISLQRSFPFVHTVRSDKGQTIYLKFPAPTFASDYFIPFQYFYKYALEDRDSYLIRKLKGLADFKIKKIESNYEFHPEFGVLTLKVSTGKDMDARKIEQAVSREFEQLKNLTIPEEEISALKRERAIAEILQTEKILYYGFLKAQELAVGGLDAYQKTIPAYLNLPADKISALFHAYPSFWTQPEQLFAKGDWAQNTSIKQYQSAATSRQSGKTQIYRGKLDNGLTVIQLHNADNAVLAFHLLFKNRSAWEPEGKTGIADFLHHALFKSSKNFPAEQLQTRIKEMGAEIKAYDWSFIPYDDYYNVPDYSYVRFVTLDQFFDDAVALLTDNIIHPGLESHFADVKKEMLSLTTRLQMNARKTAYLKFMQGILGEDHPLAQPVSGSPETIQSITPTDLVDFHQKYFSAGNTILTVVSSLDSATVFSTLQKYFARMPQTTQTVTLPDFPITRGNGRDSTKIGSRQAYIYLGYSFKAKLADAIPLKVMNSMLSNKIAFSLREQKGWAYRIGSVVGNRKDRFYFYAYLGTGRETTHPAIRGLFEEINKFKTDEITPELLQRTRNSLVAALVRRRASRENQAFTLGVNEFYGHSPQYFSSIYDQIGKITPADILRVRDAYLQADKYYLFYTIPGKMPAQQKGMPHMPPGMMRK